MKNNKNVEKESRKMLFAAVYMLVVVVILFSFVPNNTEAPKKDSEPHLIAKTT